MMSSFLFLKFEHEFGDERVAETEKIKVCCCKVALFLVKYDNLWPNLYSRYLP